MGQCIRFPRWWHRVTAATGVSTARKGMMDPHEAVSSRTIGERACRKLPRPVAVPDLNIVAPARTLTACVKRAWGRCAPAHGLGPNEPFALPLAHVSALSATARSRWKLQPGRERRAAARQVGARQDGSVLGVRELTVPDHPPGRDRACGSGKPRCRWHTGLPRPTRLRFPAVAPATVTWVVPRHRRDAVSRPGTR